MGDAFEWSLVVRQFPHRRISPEFVESVELPNSRHEDMHHHIHEIQEDPPGPPISLSVPCVDTFLLELFRDVIGH